MLRAGVSTTDLLVWSQGRSPQEVPAYAFLVLLHMLQGFKKRTKFKLIITLNDQWCQGRSSQEVPAVLMPFLIIPWMLKCYFIV